MDPVLAALDRILKARATPKRSKKGGDVPWP